MRNRSRTSVQIALSHTNLNIMLLQAQSVGFEAAALSPRSQLSAASARAEKRQVRSKRRRTLAAAAEAEAEEPSNRDLSVFDFQSGHENAADKFIRHSTSHAVPHVDPPVVHSLAVSGVYKRGFALSSDVRARVMELLQQGVRPTQIAARLMISTKTVHRYKLSAEKQQLRVPLPEPRGGYRSSIATLDRKQIISLGALLLRTPKLSIRELRQLAVEKEIIAADKVPSCSTISRAVKKLDLQWKRATYMDPKGIVFKLRDADKSEQADPQVDAAGAQLIAQERAAFRLVQREGVDGQLNPYHLLFMDETNFRLYDQQHHAWVRSHKRAVNRQPKFLAATNSFDTPEPLLRGVCQVDA
jgi:transposase